MALVREGQNAKYSKLILTKPLRFWLLRSVKSTAWLALISTPWGASISLTSWAQKNQNCGGIACVGKGFHILGLTNVRKMTWQVLQFGFVCHRSWLSTLHLNCLGLFNSLTRKGRVAALWTLSTQQAALVSAASSSLCCFPYCGPVHGSPSTAFMAVQH